MKLGNLALIATLLLGLCIILIVNTAPSYAADTDNWTKPYNKYWGDSSAGQKNYFVGCASSWGKSYCTLSGNFTPNNSLGGCATAWGNSACAIIRK